MFPDAELPDLQFRLTAPPLDTIRLQGSEHKLALYVHTDASSCFIDYLSHWEKRSDKGETGKHTLKIWIPNGKEKLAYSREQSPILSGDENERNEKGEVTDW